MNKTSKSNRFQKDQVLHHLASTPLIPDPPRIVEISSDSCSGSDVSDSTDSEPDEPTHSPPSDVQHARRISTRSIRGQVPVRCILLAAINPGDNLADTQTLGQARASPNWEYWLAGMSSEYDSLMENNTYTLVDPPPNAHILRGKWVFKEMRGLTGEITRHKARWVVRGFEQVEGIDYNETFASVVKPRRIAATREYDIEQMDVKTAFLHGSIDDRVYVEQPSPFNDDSAKVCLLSKALYGLKQAPQIWYLDLGEYLASFNFHTSR